MNPPDQNPKLPTWLFYLTDAALFGTAWFLATRSPQPLSPQVTLGIVACVITGAMVGLVPLLARFERQKNETLDDRQRSLEALARTVSASAEQISIAAGGLHGIAELAQKNLRHADQLPQRLQDKIAEFQSQLAAANDAEKEELERELVALRTTESERLESIADKIAKSTAEWARLEAATRQQLVAVNEAIARLSATATDTIGKAQLAAEEAVKQARSESVRAIETAGGNAAAATDSAKTAALAAIDAKVASAGTALIDRTAPRDTVDLVASAPAPDPKASPSEPAASPPEPAVENAPAPPKRPRKSRSDANDTSSAAIVAAEPPPIPADKIAEITPVAPHTAQPFPGASGLSSEAPGSPNPQLEAGPPNGGSIDTSEAGIAAPVEAPRPPPVRKRTAKKAPPATESALSLGIDTPAAPEAAAADRPEPVERTGSELVERILTSDGATRLLVTAYIGIGNRLFIRGEGPGLSWEKGVPLQFVSIGKWRWETHDAAAPVRYKLFKNDDLECAALGAQSLDPGHQQEVTAAF